MAQHSIDKLCKQFEISLGELAGVLQVKQPHINDWKKGRRHIPEKHKKVMCGIFDIPEDKEYLLEEETSSINSLEIELLYYTNEEDESMIQSVEKEILFEKSIEELKAKFEDADSSDKDEIINQIKQLTVDF